MLSWAGGEFGDLGPNLSRLDPPMERPLGLVR